MRKNNNKNAIFTITPRSWDLYDYINRPNIPNAQEQEYSFIHDMDVDST
jgi:hypothetical protein